MEQRWACWSSLANRDCSDSADAGSVLLTLLGSSKSGSRISSVAVAVASSFPDLRSCHQGLFQFVLLVHPSFAPVYRSRQRHRRRRRHCARAPAMGYDSLLRGAAAGLEQDGSGRPRCRSHRVAEVVSVGTCWNLLRSLLQPVPVLLLRMTVPRSYPCSMFVAECSPLLFK